MVNTENENLLNQLIGKVKEFEALRNTMCLRNVDYKLYILGVEIRKLKIEILSRMEVKLYV